MHNPTPLLGAIALTVSVPAFAGNPQTWIVTVESGQKETRYAVNASEVTLTELELPHSHAKYWTCLSMIGGVEIKSGVATSSARLICNTPNGHNITATSAPCMWPTDELSQLVGPRAANMVSSITDGAVSLTIHQSDKKLASAERDVTVRARCVAAPERDVSVTPPPPPPPPSEPPTPASEGTDVCSILNGAAIVGQDPESTFLGLVTNSLNAKSVFNEFGTHGSRFQTNSIWNQFGTFGSAFSSYSPHSESALKPPMIIKSEKIIGFLTRNRAIKGGLSPAALRVCGEGY